MRILALFQLIVRADLLRVRSWAGAEARPHESQR